MSETDPDRPLLKHEEISRTLRNEVMAGKYGENGRLPSEAQFVSRFGTSRPTVTRALRTLQDEGLVERRAGVGTFVQSTKEGGKRTFTKAFALLMPDLRHTEIFQQIAGEIAGLARVKEYSVIWGGSEQSRLDEDESLEHGEQLCDQFIDKRVDGVFFAPYELIKGRNDANRRMAQKIHDAGIPLVLIDRDFLPYPQRSEFDLVGVDNVAGGYVLGEHLVKMGCKRICFVHPERSAGTVKARIGGVRSALADYGVPHPESWIFEGDASNETFIHKILGQGRPDGLVGSNDYTAALLMQGLVKAGFEVPKELRVVGFDDVRFAALVSPPLTTISQPCQQIAQAAFRAMMERLAEPSLPPRQMSMNPRLVVRDSCGAYLGMK